MVTKNEKTLYKVVAINNFDETHLHIFCFNAKID